MSPGLRFLLLVLVLVNDSIAALERLFFVLFLAMAGEINCRKRLYSEQLISFNSFVLFFYRTWYIRNTNTYCQLMRKALNFIFRHSISYSLFSVCSGIMLLAKIRRESRKRAFLFVWTGKHSFWLRKPYFSFFAFAKELFFIHIRWIELLSATSLRINLLNSEDEKKMRK